MRGAMRARFFTTTLDADLPSLSAHEREHSAQVRDLLPACPVRVADRRACTRSMVSSMGAFLGEGE